ncbi:hypothetical protein KACHI17_04850 [Sediminibacterium sp. KACHI17]|uniref:TonB-dependent receptor n=1 Tax=Sediminibacterium sp. KACHI17 TaxID=1751071 RepID=A0AAT9GG30_9BACT
MHKSLLLFSFILLTALQIHAQVEVSGTVKDSTGKVLAGATIALIQQRTGIVLAFTLTNEFGFYQLKSDESIGKDTLLLQAGSVGYLRQEVNLRSNKQLTDFILVRSSARLPDVVVQNSKNLIGRRGDTLNYSVSAFMSVQDRVIGDVIKRLPGVEMDDNGKIKYQGKEINRFYIDGDNLLDGKYNIASNGIPVQMVDKIQVYENHQPIKSLQNAEISDKPALNISLKDKAKLKLTGSGDMAFGVPDAYQGTANLLLFKKKLKFMNYYKLNNTGLDLSSDLISHFNAETEFVPLNLLQIASNNPPLAKKRYLLNQTGLINANNLLKLSAEADIRINVSYLYDRQFQEVNSKIDYYLPGDTIQFQESYTNKLAQQSFNTNLALTINKSSYYLSNSLLLDSKPQHNYGNLISTGNSRIEQQLSGAVTNFSNELRCNTVIHKKNIIDFYSFFGKLTNPFLLDVSPGLYQSIFNQGNDYAGLLQRASVPTSFVHHSLSYRLPGKFNQLYKVGMNTMQQELNSQLDIRYLNDTQKSLADSFINQIDWRYRKLYGQIDYRYTHNATSINLSIPIVKHFIDFNHQILDQKVRSLFITPVLSVNIRGKKEKTVAVSYSYTNDWKGLQHVFDGYVMQTYRNFNTNSGSLPQQQMHVTALSYEKRNTLKVFFINIQAMYSFNRMNTIADNRFSTILQKSSLVLFDNITESSRLSMSISKHLFKLKTTVSAKITIQQDGMNQLLNGVLLSYRSRILSTEGNMHIKISPTIDFDYRGQFSWVTNMPTDPDVKAAAGVQKLNTAIQQLNMNISLSNSLLFKTRGEYYASTATSRFTNRFLFWDAAMVYKWNRLKTDIDFSITNIGGADHYTIISAAANNIVERNYRIRPRMILVKFLFHF